MVRQSTWLLLLLGVVGCGGKAQSDAGNPVGTGTGAAFSTGGTSSAGSSFGGTFSGCNAGVSCPANEQEVDSASECPQNVTCRELIQPCTGGPIWCYSLAGVDGGGGTALDAGGAASGSCPACAAAEVCIAYRLQGGDVQIPPNPNACPDGEHFENEHCAADFAYQCVALQGNCTPGKSPTCACAQHDASTCPSGYPSCSDPTAVPWLAPAAQLICELDVP
jgi:hypothetical protein